MSTFQLIAVVLTIVVLIGYLNTKIFRVQTTIAMMLASMCLAITAILLSSFHIATFPNQLLALTNSIQFDDLLLNSLLSFLLFAGALTINVDALKKQKYEIGILATLSTILSTLLVAIASYYILNKIGIVLSWPMAFLFGALISPTDPIAVLATFKDLGAPRFLKASVAGESLFNDGVGIVLFTSLLELVTMGTQPSLGHVLILFCQEALGGVLYGFVLGYLSSWLCRQTADSKLTLLTTLAITTSGYYLASTLDVSGPLAMVVAGIYLRKTLKQTPHFDYLASTWETIDEVLNTILFLLIGLEIINTPFPKMALWASLLMIPTILLIRLLTVSLPINFLPKRRRKRGMITLLTWGGLRGGLAIALALALPLGHIRDVILTITYSVVAFSVIVQGLTIPSLVRRFYPPLQEKARKI